LPITVWFGVSVLSVVRVVQHHDHIFPDLSKPESRKTPAASSLTAVASEPHPLSTKGVSVIMASSEVTYDTAIDEDAPGLPISVPDSGDTGEGRLKMIIQLLKRSLGVKDLAAMFVSFSYKQGYLTLNSLTI
jgi:hypothetical protein